MACSSNASTTTIQVVPTSYFITNPRVQRFWTKTQLCQITRAGYSQRDISPFGMSEKNPIISLLPEKNPPAPQFSTGWRSHVSWNTTRVLVKSPFWCPPHRDVFTWGPCKKAPGSSNGGRLGELLRKRMAGEAGCWGGFIRILFGGFHSHGGIQKWWVFVRENPI